MSDKPDATMMKEILQRLPGWQLDPRYAGHMWCSVIVDKEGHEVRVELERGRLRFAGQWPDGEFSDKTVAITVAADSPTEKIRVDFTRRFLPAYLETWGTLKTRAVEKKKYADATEATRVKLAKLPGVRRSSHGSELYGPNCTTINVQGPDSIRLECRGNFTVKQLTKILKTLQST